MIHIIWSGYGFLVFVIAFIDSLIAELLTRFISNDENAYEKNQIPLGISFLFSALVISILFRYFENRRKENRGTRVFDKVTLAQKSTFFFIPFQYWSYIFTAIGIVVIITQIKHG